MPAAITFTSTNGGDYILTEYWEPRDGAYYADDIRAKFPTDAADQVLIHHHTYVDPLTDGCWEKAKDSLQSVLQSDFYFNSQSRRDAAITAAILEHHQSEKPDGLLNTVSYVIPSNQVISGTPAKGEQSRILEEAVFVYYLNRKFSVSSGEPQEVSSIFMHAVLSFTVTEDGEYILKDYWELKDSSRNPAEFQSKYPSLVIDSAESYDEYTQELESRCLAQAKVYLQNPSIFPIQSN